MDRVLSPWAGPESSWFPTGNVMIRPQSGLGPDEKDREWTSDVMGDSPCL